MKYFGKRTAAVLVVLLTAHSISWPADYYVSTAGNDTLPGTLAMPWRTIQKAATTMVAGDQVFIRRGTYDGFIEPVHSGQPGLYITYRSYPGEQAIINVADTSLSGIGIALRDNRSLSYLRFSNLTIMNAGGANVYAGAAGMPKSNLIFDSLTIDNGYLGIIFRDGVTDSRITHCEIHNCQFNVYIERLNTNILIDSNHVSNSHEYWAGSFWSNNIHLQGEVGLENRFITVSNNHVHHAAIQGIQVWHCADVVVRGNHSHHNGATGIQIESAGGPRITQRIIVEDNLCEDNSQVFTSETGIWIDDSDSVIVQNNLLRRNEVGLKISGSYHVIARRNTIYENRHATYINASGVYIRSTDQRGGAGDNVVVHNTLHANALNSQRSQVNIGVFASDSGEVLNCVFANNIASDPQSPYDLWIQGTTHRLDYNLYYRPTPPQQVVWQETVATWPSYLALSHQDSHSVVTDPLFADVLAFDFSLAETSPCIDAGGFLTEAVNSGPGDQLQVADARYFSDGFGLIQGDLIQVESGDTARVVAIDYSAGFLGLSRTVAWQPGDGVGYPYLGSGPDIGAHEHDPTIKGDTNGDGVITAADVIHLVNYVFKAGPAPVGTDSGDTNCDGAVTAADVIVLVDYVFKSGPQPACS